MPFLLHLMLEQLFMVQFCFRSNAEDAIAKLQVFAYQRKKLQVSVDYRVTVSSSLARDMQACKLFMLELIIYS